MKDCLRHIYEIMTKQDFFVLVLTMSVLLQFLHRDCCEFLKEGLLCD